MLQLLSAAYAAQVALADCNFVINCIIVVSLCSSCSCKYNVRACCLTIHPGPYFKHGFWAGLQRKSKVLVKQLTWVCAGQGQVLHSTIKICSESQAKLDVKVMGAGRLPSSLMSASARAFAMR